MLFVFRSDASSEVMMFGDAAKKLLKIIGKDPEDKQGIVTVEQLPEAIARLRAAIDEDKARQAARTPEQEEADVEAGRVGMAAPVGLAQRAWPLLDMLEAAHQEEVPVIWGA